MEITIMRSMESNICLNISFLFRPPTVTSHLVRDVLIATDCLNQHTANTAHSHSHLENIMSFIQ